METITAVSRNPDQTRHRILLVAFEEIVLKGYQGLRVDKILSLTGLTKGAFYHHFKSKHALGLAVIDEVLEPWVVEQWVTPVSLLNDGIDSLIEMFVEAREQINLMGIHMGCPLNNITQEMSPLDEEFRLRVSKIWDLWSHALIGFFERGQQQGLVKKSIVPQNVARFIIATIEGIIGQCKCDNSDAAFDEAGACLREYIESLKA